MTSEFGFSMRIRQRDTVSDVRKINALVLCVKGMPF